MAATSNKQEHFSRVVKTLAKKFPTEPAADARPVLEELLYALCREGATSDQATEAFQRLKKGFHDWNEIRVSTVAEISEALQGLPDAGAKAQRLVEFLQELFEADYTFSLEGMDKKGLKQAARQLGRYQGVTDFAVAWVLQRSLNGHTIPLDEPALRVLRRLKVVDAEADDIEALRGTVEHYVSKSEGWAFTEALAELAVKYCTDADPACGKCPLKPDCPTGQVLTGRKPEPKAAAKPKPKSR